MTSSLECVPPVLLDSIVLDWLVAMVTLPWHSGRLPDCTWVAEKGGVSPLVLFTGVTGHRQEAAHRELRVRLCGMTTVCRHQVMPSVPGQNLYIQPKLWTLRKISSSVQEILFSLPLPASSITPPEDCVPMRGHTGASFPLTLFALCWLEATPPLSSAVTDCTSAAKHTKGGGE